MKDSFVCVVGMVELKRNLEDFKASRLNTQNMQKQVNELQTHLNALTDIVNSKKPDTGAKTDTIETNVYQVKEPKESGKNTRLKIKSVDYEETTSKSNGSRKLLMETKNIEAEATSGGDLNLRG